MTMEKTHPRTQRELIEAEFIEHRTKILDIAAFLDRFDRASARDAEDEFRIVAFRRALEDLAAPGFGRVERIQMLLSDQNSELLDERDQQNAFGAAQPPA